MVLDEKKVKFNALFQESRNVETLRASFFFSFSPRYAASCFMRTSKFHFTAWVVGEGKMGLFICLPGCLPQVARGRGTFSLRPRPQEQRRNFAYFCNRFWINVQCVYIRVMSLRPNFIVLFMTLIKVWLGGTKKERFYVLEGIHNSHMNVVTYFNYERTHIILQ